MDNTTASSDKDGSGGVSQCSQPVKKEPKNIKTRCGGTWTQARYNSFIKSALRTASVRWPPRYQCLHDAFSHQGVNPATGRQAKLYRCCKCQGLFPQANIEINHIVPVVPVEGFDSWDNLIERLFCEKDKLEAVCKPCHKAITAGENKQRKDNKNNE